MNNCRTLIPGHSSQHVSRAKSRSAKGYKVVWWSGVDRTQRSAHRSWFISPAAYTSLVYFKSQDSDRHARMVRKGYEFITFSTTILLLCSNASSNQCASFPVEARQLARRQVLAVGRANRVEKPSGTRMSLPKGKKAIDAAGTQPVLRSAITTSTFVRHSSWIAHDLMINMESCLESCLREVSFSPADKRKRD